MTGIEVIELRERNPISLADRIEVHQDPPPRQSENVPMLRGLREEDELEVLQISKSQESSPRQESFVSWKRWPMLFLVFNCIFWNSFIWISFAPVANYTNGYYGEGSAAWFSLFFMLSSFSFGIIGLNVGEFFGHEAVVICASGMNVIGSTLRIFTSWWRLPPLDEDYRYWIALLGQVIAGAGYPFVMYLPSKTSQEWFPAEERTLATTVGVMGGPAAVLVANLLVPQIVRSTDDFWFLDFVLFLGIICHTPACLLSFMAKEHDAEITGVQTMGYGQSFRECFSNKDYILTLIVLAGGIGLFNCLYTVMLEMLCPVGYSNAIVGICAVTMISAGILGSVIVSLFVDRNKSHLKVFRVAISLAVALGICFLSFTHIPNLSPLLIVVATLFGLTGLASYPVGLEIATEAAFPAALNVVSGSIVLCGQAFSIIFVILVRFFAKPVGNSEIDFEQHTCRVDSNDVINVPKNYLTPIIIIGTISLSLIPLAMCIDVKYKRRKAEKDAKDIPNYRAILEEERELRRQQEEEDCSCL